MNACPEPEALVLVAHGETTDASALEHVSSCGPCSAFIADVKDGEGVAQRVAAALARPARSAGRAPEVDGYAIEREIGRGGMGVVYSAVQKTSGRRVALKVVRGAGWVGETTLRLFQREIQVLARLSHRGIAALYDAGATAEGEHWFAMELVEGRTLLADANARGLSRRERLELFAKICDAIQHAHQKGVVHRDLKPSNVLVDAHGEPRVLDFGLARITEADVAVATVASEPGSIRGTLVYMSPEQARGDGGAVGSPSDVYSLGVVLYELLTGALPHDVTRVSFPEALRLICEVAPTRPSARDASIGGDLETILLTALDKEPERRYASAAAFAGDVRRFLADQVILARPASGAYQLKKLVARHRLSSALVGAVFVTAIGSAIWLARAYARADDERVLAGIARDDANLARDAATVARDLARDESQRAEAARVLAEERRVEAEGQSQRRQQTLDYFMEMIGKARNESAGPDVRVVDLVEKSAADLESRTDLAPDVAATIALNVAGVENSLGRHERAEERLRWALAKLEESGSARLEEMAFIHIQLAFVHQIRGRFDAAQDELAEIAALVEAGAALGQRSILMSDTVRAKQARARGDWTAAGELLRSVLERTESLHGRNSLEARTALTDLAILLADQGRTDDALPLTEDLVARTEQALGPRHSSTLNARVNLAMLFLDLGRNEEARAMLEDALDGLEEKLGPDHVQVLLTTNNLAGAYSRLKQNERALEIWRELLERQSRKLGENAFPTLNTRKNMGTMLYELKKFADAAEFQQDLVQRCDEHLPSGNMLRAMSRTSLGKSLVTLKRFDEAEAVLLESVEILRGMRGANPAWMRNAADLLVATYERAGTPEKAEPYRELARTGVVQ